MSDEREVLSAALGQALSGRGAHTLTAEAFDGLDWQLAGRRPEGAPYSVFELLNHLAYWQEFALGWLDGEKPETPEHAADSWPGEAAPADEAQWQAAVERFKRGLAEHDRRAGQADLFTRLGPKTALEILQLIASHNSYHAGQVALVRRMLGAWPPPGGGATW